LGAQGCPETRVSGGRRVSTAKKAHEAARAFRVTVGLLDPAALREAKEPRD